MSTLISTKRFADNTFIKRELEMREAMTLSATDKISIGTISVIQLEIGGISHYRCISQFNSYDNYIELKKSITSGNAEISDFSTYKGLAGLAITSCEESMEEVAILPLKSRFLGAVQTTSTDKTDHYKAGWLIELFQTLSSDQKKRMAKKEMDFYFQINPDIDNAGAYYEIIPTERAYKGRLDDKPDRIVDAQWLTPQVMLKDKHVLPTQYYHFKKAIDTTIKIGGTKKWKELGDVSNQLEELLHWTN